MVDRVLSRSHRGRLALVVLLGAFLALAATLPPVGGTSLDQHAATWLARRATDGGAIAFTWISWLGDTALSGLLVAAVVMLAHRRRWIAAATVTVAGIGAPLLNIMLKQLFHRGRPDYAIEFLAGTTWSFPSGHVMSSIVGFGVVAYFRHRHERHPLRRKLIVLLACVIVTAVGYSRLYLGVHYLSDVVGGLLAGGVWLLVCLEGYRYASSRLGAGSGAAARPALGGDDETSAGVTAP